MGSPRGDRTTPDDDRISIFLHDGASVHVDQTLTKSRRSVAAALDIQEETSSATGSWPSVRLALAPEERTMALAVTTRRQPTADRPKGTE
jgi:hypothetical protein